MDVVTQDMLRSRGKRRCSDDFSHGGGGAELYPTTAPGPDSTSPPIYRGVVDHSTTREQVRASSSSSPFFRKGELSPASRVVERTTSSAAASKLGQRPQDFFFDHTPPCSFCEVLSSLIVGLASNDQAEKAVAFFDWMFAIGSGKPSPSSKTVGTDIVARDILAGLSGEEDEQNDTTGQLVEFGPAPDPRQKSGMTEEVLHPKEERPAKNGAEMTGATTSTVPQNQEIKEHSAAVLNTTRRAPTSTSTVVQLGLDLSCYSALIIAALRDLENVPKALKIFAAMVGDGLEPDAVLHDSLVIACAADELDSML